MTLQAAAASRLNFEELARALPGAAEGGALAGASSEETIGALSVLAGRFKSGDTAADRLKAFTSKVGLDTDAEGRESLAGSGIVDAVTKLQAMSDEQRKDFLGESQEVNAAYVILTEEFAAIQGRIQEIEQARDATGTAQSPVALRRAIAEQDPKLKALLERNRAANRREIKLHFHDLGLFGQQKLINLLDMLISALLHLTFKITLAILGQNIVILHRLRLIHPVFATATNSNSSVLSNALNHLHQIPPPLFGQLGDR
jgi:hypothetical protein